MSPVGPVSPIPVNVPVPAAMPKSGPIAEPEIVAAPASPKVDTHVPEVTPPIDEPGLGPLAPTGNVLIARMNVQADLTDEAKLPRGPERKQAVFDDLVATAKTSQVDALAKLEQLKASGEVTGIESLFMPNAILITTKAGASQAVSDALKGIANIGEVAENKTWSVQNVADEVSVGTAGAAAGAALLQYAQQLGRTSWPMGVASGSGVSDEAKAPEVVAADKAPEAPVEEAPVDAAPAPVRAVGPETGAPEWGVAKIGAPQAWAEGANGTGVTVGIVDTGLDATHPAIKSHYRGTNADGSQTHDYNWFDPFKHAATPYDDGEHGTHVAGTTAGGMEGRGIGVAPGAKIIAAKAINGSGYNTTAATLQALQFMLAPTKTDGSAPDPTKGADVINNSWGNANQDDTTFMESFAALKAAGIEVVTAAGNDGPREGTVSPPGSYPGYLSVAATNTSDKVTSFSSRGPSKFVSPDEMTPNVAAPGAGVVSSVPGGGFQRMDGTSMASPHVAGAVAVLLSKFPQATHQQIVAALTKTAVDIDKPGPDNASGFGRIDLPKALAALGSMVDPQAADQ
jgi:subtilisin family serine protease